MKSFAILATFGAVLLAAPGQAIIISTSGSANLISAPANAQLNVITSSTLARCWNEAQGFTLTSTLKLDAAASGSYTTEASLPSVQPTVTAGTVVNSHYVHFDSPGGASASATGSVTFDQDILGVICKGDAGSSNKTLDLSDYLSSGTLYDDGLVDRGVELASNGDLFTISADRRTVNFHFAITEPGDRIRIVTVPEPATVLILISGLGILVNRRRSRS